MKATNNELPESWLDAYPLSRSSTLVRQLTSLVLPFVVVLVVPFLLLFDFRQFSLRIRLPFPFAQIVLGTILCTIGLLLLATTISRFARQGRGTLTPWGPPKHLVIQGPYAYTRNPMITGVAFVLLGEAVVFGALSIRTRIYRVSKACPDVDPENQAVEEIKRCQKMKSSVRSFSPSQFP